MCRYWSCSARSTNAACAVLRCRRNPNWPVARLPLLGALGKGLLVVPPDAAVGR